MIDYIQWRWRSNRRGVDGIEVRTTELVGMVMVYDSQYTCDACVTRRNRSKAREPKNETAIAVCRRMVQAATDRNALIVWVKVKGHSGDEGNDAADKRANWAQNGGVEHEQDVTRMMDYIREYGW
jgi:ribonuclease HI